MSISAYCNKGVKPLPSGNVTTCMAPAAPMVPTKANGLATKLLRTRKKSWMPPRITPTYGISSGCFLRLMKSAMKA